MGANTWRAASLPSKLCEIARWVLIEHPDFQSDEMIQPSGPVYALYITCSEEKGSFPRFSPWLASRRSFSFLL